MGQWYENTVPKCKWRKYPDEVLVTVETQGYSGRIYRRVIKAIYIPHHRFTIEDMGWCMYDGVPDDWERVKDEDTWWIPEGWYEVCDYCDDYSYFEISDKVIAWMKLPKPYEPKIKNLGDVK